MKMLEFLELFPSASGDATLEAVFPKGWKPMPGKKFDWNRLPDFYLAAAAHDLSTMTFDEYPYRVRSIQVDYGRKRIRILVGDACR
jgi:hypothetical protein